ncbi:VOC family protein [Paenibacillus mesophilus]|uniref:VOC family protein n=1 Tax=Paenibacillus mesophilus TaxID=2582849 RepID=UPI00110EFBC7|nr:VOC family protein [Paenibacillus mesophilus]TMV51609.1 VOC family protein [Paenibacillus mesophilus]
MSDTTAVQPAKPVHPIVNKVGGVFMHVSNMERSVNWYHKLFGMPERSSVTDKVHALKMQGGYDFVLDQHGYDRKLAPKDRPILMFDSPDVHAAFRFIQQIGITPVWRIEEYPGMAFFTFRDPDGNLLMVCGKPGSKEEKEEAKADTGAAEPVRYDGGGCQLIVRDSAYYSANTREGLELTGGAVTELTFATPLRIETTVKIEGGCLRLKYGKHGGLTFNYGPSANNGAGEEFYVRHPAVNKDFSYLDKGAIPVREWVRVSWTIQERSMEVHVNGELFHVQQGYFGNLVSKAGIGCDNGKITVKSFVVEPLSKEETMPRLAVLREGMEADELVPDISCFPQLTGEGLWLAYNEEWGSARTTGVYSTPFTVEAVVCSDTNSVVLYGGTSARAKFHQDGSFSFLDPITKEEIWAEGKGKLGDGFSTVQWRMEADRTTVSVDGELRFERAGDYADCRFAIGVGADIGSAVVVKSIAMK